MDGVRTKLTGGQAEDTSSDNALDQVEYLVGYRRGAPARRRRRRIPVGRDGILRKSIGRCGRSERSSRDGELSRREGWRRAARVADCGPDGSSAARGLEAPGEGQ